jgi:hypothetical protein
MATYRVQAGDTPASIAKKLSGNGDLAAQLIDANPQKQRQVIDGGVTFKSLKANELLAVPGNWARPAVRSLGALGLGDVTSDAAAVMALSPTALCTAGNATIMQFQTDWNAANPTSTQLTVDGKYGPATQGALQASIPSGQTAPESCPAYASAGTTYTQAQMVAYANGVIADSTICSGTPNANVSNFQAAYNSVTGSTLSVDGEYGPATYAAMNGLLSMAGVSLTGTIPQACAIYTPASGGGGTTPTPAPGGGSTVNVTNTTASTSLTPLVVGALALAAGVGAFYYLRRHHTPTAARTTPATHRLAAHHARRR